jgi:F-type H+-transporting ATPase subunit gamma
LLRQADHFLGLHSKERLKLILFGQKSVDHYSKKAYDIHTTYVNYASKIQEANVREWCAEFTRLFEEKELDEVWMVYTHYKNVLARETKVEKILPMQKEQMHEMAGLDTSDETSKGLKTDYIFEPDANEIYLKLIPYALCTKVQSLLLESQASELSARVVSMKAATTNAEDMITKLTLIKNKIRQFGITKEILEISAGAEGVT